MSSSALDFTSDLFDPVKALSSNKVSLPFPKAKTYNNIAEYFSRKCLKQPRVPTTTKMKVEPRERNYEWYYDTLQLSQSQRARIRRFKKIKRRKGKKPVSIVTIPCEPLRSNRITKCQSDFKDYCRRKYPYLNNISASQDMSWSYVQQMAQTDSVLGENQLESVPASFIKSEPFDSVPTSIIKTEPIDSVSTSIIKTEPDSMSTPVIKMEPFNSVSTSIIKTELSDASFTSGTKAEPVSETFSGLEILKPGQMELCTLSPMENADNKIHFEKACSLENQCKSSTMTKDFEDQPVVSYSKEQINKNSKQSATFYKRKVSNKVSISSVTDKTESSNYTVVKDSSVRELHCKTRKRKKKTIDSLNTCKASSMSTVSMENKLLTSLPNEEKEINKHSTKPCKIKIKDKQLIKKKCHPDDLTLLPVSSMVPNDEFKLTTK
ncbi:voltage-dependent calcium channel type A subunit alpha-1 [Caerostris extrusa]|uniref:Voltage-dependent calcium channel type A subunit alpha-1 n=1 Tax=Caerostris extrusa TaxID=172846 RepID=A0AAV4V060_CAEEX|nr:voltage-dependent calcium channel type A subunit alpha-1 [Caerostris extrusa]